MQIFKIRFVTVAHRSFRISFMKIQRKLRENKEIFF